MVDLKTLEALLKLCRRHGVLSLDAQDIKFSLSEFHSPIANGRSKKKDETQTEEAFDWDDLDEDQKLFWSSLPSTTTGDKV